MSLSDTERMAWSSVSARGGSCRHLTPLFSSERPELEPRASKKKNNSREDRELLSLEMTKRTRTSLCWRGKGVWWDSFRSIEDCFPDIGGACHHRTTRNVRDLDAMSGGVLVDHARELRAPEPRSGETEAPW